MTFECDFDRWYAYLKDAIVEAVIDKDILQSRKVANPALFRQAFEHLCRFQSRLYAIEVKSGRKKSAKGLEAFAQHFPEARPVIVTPDNFPQLSEDPKAFLAALA